MKLKRLLILQIAFSIFVWNSMASAIATDGAISVSHKCVGPKLSPKNFETLSIASQLALVPAIEFGNSAECFKKYGIKLKTTIVATTQIGMAGLVGGSFDLVVNTPTNLLLAIANGNFDGRLVVPRHGYTDEELIRAKLEPYYPGELLLQSALIVASKSSIKNWGDLAGKKIALQSINSADHAGALLAMMENKVDVSSVEFLSIPSSQMESALKQGDVDAVIPNDPFASQIINVDGGKIIGYPQAYFAQPGVAVAYVSSGKVVKAKRKALMAFKSAIFEINKLINDPVNQPSYRALSAKISGISPLAASKIRIPDFITQDVNESELNSTQKKLIKVGFMKKMIDSKKILNW